MYVHTYVHPTMRKGSDDQTGGIVLFHQGTVKMRLLYGFEAAELCAHQLRPSA